jgi:hypothetical protein
MQPEAILEWASRFVLAVLLVLAISASAAGNGRQAEEFELLATAEQDSPIPAPPDVILTLEMVGGQHQFRLGELIPITFAYSTTTVGKYLRVPSDKLAAGRPLEVSCSPAVEPASRQPSPSDVLTFEQMLHASCGGVGGGIGSGCGDCDGELPLTTIPVGFGILPLNLYMRFRQPGRYTCEASSAEITAAPRDEKVRSALLVKSNPISLTIVDDRAWSHAALVSYSIAYDRSCQADDVPRYATLQCLDMAERITYLDTPESLAAEVKRFDGRNHGWHNGFWDAIRLSSYPSEAVRLMTSRMQEPDFQVSTATIEWLASTELRLETPDAFLNGTAADYHDQAVKKLRKHVRLLGSSVSSKNAAVISESIKTYRWFSEQDYCERQPLIPKDEQDRVFAELNAHR